MEAILLLLGSLALIPLLIIYSGFSWGFVVSKFYIWFVVSAIPGLPLFTLLQFIGFSLFLNALMPPHTESIKDEYKNKEAMWTLVVIRPWLALFTGWLIHLFY